MTSQADKLTRDAVARELFTAKMIESLKTASTDPNKAVNAGWLALDCFRDADAFMAAREEHERLMSAKPQEADDDLAG